MFFRPRLLGIPGEHVLSAQRLDLQSLAVSIDLFDRLYLILWDSMQLWIAIAELAVLVFGAVLGLRGRLLGA